MTKEKLYSEIFWFTEPVFDAASDQEKLIIFFKNFGYELDPKDVESLFKTFQTLSTTIEGICSSTDTESEIDPQDILNLFNAIKLLGQDQKVKIYFVADFFSEIFDYLLFRYISIKQTTLSSIFNALGIIELKEIEAEVRGVAYVEIKFNWKRFVEFINDNKKWAKEVYGWNGNPGAGDEKYLDYKKLVNTLALLLETVGYSLVNVDVLSASELLGYVTNKPSSVNLHGASLPFIQSKLDTIDSDGKPVFTDEAGFKLLPYGDFNLVQNLGIALSPYFKGSVIDVHKLSENLTLVVNLTSSADGGAFVIINPNGVSAGSGGNVNAAFSFLLKYSNQNPSNCIELININNSSKLEASVLKLEIGGNLKGEFYLAGGCENLKATINVGEDGLLRNFITEPIVIEIGNLLLGWTNTEGVYFEGGNNFSVTIPLHLELGPINITEAVFTVDLDGKSKFTLETSGNLNLGPLVASVKGFGITVELIVSDNGVLGEHDLIFGIKPPNGVGLSLDTGVIIGGGYLYIDTEKGSYAGALQLSINNFLSLTAIGLIETKMPDGSDGFSLLIIVTAEFSPAFQLGYGFTLNGVGGLLGLNREVLLDPLRDRVRSGAINGIMFPTDVIANAPAIISDMQAIFPVKEGYFLIGPMAKIGWGTPTLISLSLGVIIQLPDPKIAILGVLKIVLPTEEAAVLKLQVNFLGTIDPSNQLITFDASLFDSNILKVLTLTGDMAVRLRWGDKPDFILSAGGFHPEYGPTMSMPALQRIGIKILDLEQARIQVLTYFALTSNTVQFGARADCYFGLDGFSVYGYMGFDTLMQFSPFCFEALAASGFTLDTALGDASIRINARLKGPTPWYVKATGSIEVFGFEFEAEYEKEWGKSQKEELPEIALKPLLLEEFKKKEVWSAALPEGTNQLISVSNPEIQDSAAEPFIIYPNGNLIISQKLVPFKMKLEKLGNQMISDIHEVQISALNISGTGSVLSDISDTFAIGQYLELSNQEKISKPSFESMKCGVKATWNSGTNTFKIGSTVRRSQEYEQIWIDKEKKKGLASFKTQKFTELLRGSAASKSKLSQKYRSALGKSVIKTAAKDLVFEVVNINDHKLIDTTASFNSFVEASQYLNKISSGNEALRSGLTVIEK